MYINDILVLIKPEEYDSFLTFLAEHKFLYASGNVPGTGECVLEKCHDGELSTVYIIHLENNLVGYFPLEIYQPGSPTRDDEKFNYYMQQTISCDDAKARILEYQN